MVGILLLLQEYPMTEVEAALMKAEEAASLRADIVRHFLVLESGPVTPLPALVPEALQGFSIPRDTPDHFDALLGMGGVA